MDSSELFDPLCCKHEDKAALEARNSIFQLQFIADVVNVWKAKEIRLSHILELHRLAVMDVYPCAGVLRTALYKLNLDGSRHIPPDAWQVPGLVNDLVDRINSKTDRSELHKAAYAMWRLNWIHPFCGGNGRTARALAYLIVCMAHGTPLPGEPSMPELIMQRHTAYTASLREADAAEKLGKEGLGGMFNLVSGTLVLQLLNAIKKATGR